MLTLNRLLSRGLQISALLLLLISLHACTLLPHPEPEPKRLQLALPMMNTNPLASSGGLHLAIDRPNAAGPLRSRDLWYREEQALNAFSRYQWAESLDLQLQRWLVHGLGQASWTHSVLPDQPGFTSDLRLLLTLDQWYLNLPEQTLDIDLQITLLDPQGVSLYQRRWQAKPSVAPVSPLGMVQASQIWLEAWLIELEADLGSL
ncbi:ABC-type transport auxiliary lipoprotein family protein [Marinospirillum sp. MEB164]|uniref:ABC-type transport auxiliary lipoprotein family protein n=1 Tax=Marinospirillum alkalitolerans TaxID=3123374 RepID=A0ABW8PVW6_9GAMM